MCLVVLVKLSNETVLLTFRLSIEESTECIHFTFNANLMIMVRQSRRLYYFHVALVISTHKTNYCFLGMSTITSKFSLVTCPSSKYLSSVPLFFLRNVFQEKENKKLK